MTTTAELLDQLAGLPLLDQKSQLLGRQADLLQHSRRVREELQRARRRGGGPPSRLLRERDEIGQALYAVQSTLARLKYHLHAAHEATSESERRLFERCFITTARLEFGKKVFDRLVEATNQRLQELRDGKQNGKAVSAATAAASAESAASGAQ